MLSYSTLGSGAGEDVDKVRNATAKIRAAAPDLPVEGEIQFDAAVSPNVARTKCKDSKVATPTPSSSPTSTPATSATRLPASGQLRRLRPHPCWA